MVHMALSRRSCGDKIEDRRVDANGYIRLFYANFAVFIVLGHKGSLVINFPINRTQGLVERIKHSSIPLSPPSHSYFLRGVCLLHGVREMRKGIERPLQSSNVWEDVVVVFTPCRLLICINIDVLLDQIISYLMLIFHFLDF
jgi:hypothetical protein